MRNLQKFAAVHASVFNDFNQERSLSSRAIYKRNRAAALAEWRQLGAAKTDSHPALGETNLNPSDTSIFCAPPLRKGVGMDSPH